MGFNDNPYIKFKLENNEYSQVRVATASSGSSTLWKIAWRKPLNYVKEFKIVNSSGAIKSQDAVYDGALSFSLKKKVNGVWVDCLEPEDNNTSQISGGPAPIVLSNQDIIRYGNDLKFSCSISAGYTTYGSNNRGKEVTPNGDVYFNIESSNRNIKNDFYLYYKVRPILYNLTVNTDSHVSSVDITHSYDHIANVQGLEGLVDWIPGQILYYGDFLETGLIDCDPGWKLDTDYFSTVITQNTTWNITTSPKKTLVGVSTSQYGISSYSIYRTAGTVAQELGISSGNITTGDYLYYGDTIQVTTVVENGYSTTSNYTININDTWLDNHPTSYTFDIVATPVEYDIKISLSGDTTWNNQNTISNIDIKLITKGTISQRITQGNAPYGLYYGVAKSNDFIYCKAYYGDTITINCSTLTANSSYPWTTSPRQGADYNVQKVIDGNYTASITVSVKEFNLSLSSDVGIQTMDVYRTASPYKGRPQEQVYNNSTIYYGDTLTLKNYSPYYEAKTGYYTLSPSGTAPTYDSVANEYKWESIQSALNIYGSSWIEQYSTYIISDSSSGISNVKITLTQAGVKSGRTVGTILYNGVLLNSSSSYCTVYHQEEILVEYTVTSGYTPLANATKTVNGSNVEIYASGSPTAYNLYINKSGDGWSHIKVTCTNPGVGPHTTNQVLYDGAPKSNAESYCLIYKNERLYVEYSTISAYEPTTASDTVLVSTADVTLYNDTALFTYTLSLSANAGINTLYVYRTYRQYPSQSSTKVRLQDGDTINYGDTIQVGADTTLNTGYAFDVYPPVTYTNVTDDLSIVFTAHKIWGTYEEPQIPGVANISVTKSDPNAGTISVNDGDVIYYGDVLTVSANPEPGWDLGNYQTQYTFQPASDQESWEPVINPTVESYTLDVDADSTSISNYSMVRTSSPVGNLPTGNISSGAPVAYGDVLEITINSNTNYVVGPGYATSYTATYTCPDCTTDNNKWHIELEGTRVVNLTIHQRASNYQSSGANSNLDSEDQITLKVRYPDNPNTPVNYDSSKLIRVDQVVTIWEADQTFKEALPSIERMNIRSGGPGSFRRIYKNNTYSYWTLNISEMYIDNNVVISEMYFEVAQINVEFEVTSDLIKNINPDNATVTVTVYSKYKTGTTTYTYSLEDYSINGSTEDLDLYYKDRLTITYTNVTGWSFNSTEVDIWNGNWMNVDSLTNGGNYTLVDLTSHLIRITRNIRTYNLTFRLSLGKFTSIKIDDVEKLTSTWTNLGGVAEVKYFNVYYGSKFSKNSVIPDGNAVMSPLEDTHQNDYNYNVTGSTTVSFVCSPKIARPIIMSVSYSVSGWNLTININVYSSMSYGYPYDLKVTIDTQGNNPQHLEATDSMTSHSQQFSHTVDSQQLFYTYNYSVTVKVKLLGKVLGGVTRTDSDEASSVITVTVPGWGIS